MERGRIRTDGSRSLPPAFSVLRGKGKALLPDVPEIGGQLSRRAIQHHQLFASDLDDRPAVRFGSGRFYLDGRRLPHLFKSYGAGQIATQPRATSFASTHY